MAPPLVGILTGSGDLANVANMAGQALISGYGRDMELEADQLGAQYLNGSATSPNAMIDVVRLLKNQEMLEVQMARQENRKPRVYHGVFSIAPGQRHAPEGSRPLRRKVVKTPRSGPTTATSTSAHIDGLPLGSSRAQGMVRGSRFYHADLGITVAFPTGWVVENQPRKRARVPARQAGCTWR